MARCNPKCESHTSFSKLKLANDEKEKVTWLSITQIGIQANYNKKGLFSEILTESALDKIKKEKKKFPALFSNKKEKEKNCVSKK